MGEVRLSGTIRILPFDQAGAQPVEIDGDPGADPLAWAPHRRFMPSARSALEAVLISLGLDPADEVLITNTSGQKYIPSCVTCTVFNHCQPSRIWTDRTRAAVVIHEYGYPHPRLRELCATAGARGIPVIEDCAHSIDSEVDGTPLGTFGDFAIFSLPKVMPIAGGGVLVGAETVPDIPPALAGAGNAAEAGYEQYMPALAELSRRRRANHDAVRRAFAELPPLMEQADGVTPFFVGLVTPDAAGIKRRSAAVQWGTTLRDDLLLVPTNPFVDSSVLVATLQSAFGARVLP